MKNKFIIPLVLCVLFLTALACISGGGGTNVKACVDITVTSCDLDQYGGYVHGIVTNKCDTKVNAVKIVAEVFSADGLLLSSDDEYVENLAPNEQKTFKAIMDSPASQGKTCKAKIDSGY